MSHRRKDNKPTGVNWIKEQSQHDRHVRDLERLEAVKIEESKHHFQTVRKDSKTVILKRID